MYMMKWHFNLPHTYTKPPASGYGIQWGNQLINSLPLASQEHHHRQQWLRTVAIIKGPPQVEVTALWSFLASKLSGFGARFWGLRLPGTKCYLSQLLPALGTS